MPSSYGLDQEGVELIHPTSHKNKGKAIMSASQYIKDLRGKIGNSLLLLPGVAAVISNDNNEILLQEKHKENWSLFAGRNDKTRRISQGGHSA